MKPKMQHLKLGFALLLISVVLSGCAGKNNDTIVTVNDTAITKTQFDKEFKQVMNNPEFKEQGVDLNNAKNKPLALVIKGRLIDEMIVKTLLNEEIAKRKITVSDEEFNAEYKKILDSVGSEDKLKDILKQSGVSMEQFKKDFRTELLQRKFIDEVAKTSVTDKDALKFYNDNKNMFKMPERVRASHILISANPDEIRSVITADDANKALSPADVDKLVNEKMQTQLQKAQDILAKVKQNPADFAKIAAEQSDDKQSARMGGDLGEFSYDKMVEPFSKAAFALKPNTISNIVTTPYGYHIILVKDRMAASVEPYEKIKNELRSSLEMQKKTEVLAKFFDSAKKSAKIVYNDKTYSPEYIQNELREVTKLPPGGAPEAAQPNEKK